MLSNRCQKTSCKRFVKSNARSMLSKECQKRCAENGNCRYSNTPRAINNTQKKGACYHSFGNRGQYTVSGGNSQWITMGNKNFIPKVSQVESWEEDINSCSDSKKKTVYHSIPAGATVTKLFYKFKGKDQGHGNPTGVPHLGVKDNNGNWHDVWDESKKGSHNIWSQGGDRTLARGAMINHNAMKTYDGIIAGPGNNVRIKYQMPMNSGHCITTTNSRFSVEFRD